MSDVKPITIYIHASGPNPKKVLIVMEELGIPYETVIIPDPKVESFTKINPNGRLPAIIDPNTDLTLWESGAIVEYLVETYDKEGKLTPQSFADKWHARQYLQFQMSGQGPYFGQLAYFGFIHPEKIPQAITRYREQTVRVVMVLDKILEGKQYLLGDKVSYADVCFIPWDQGIVSGMGGIWEDFDCENKYPNFAAWHKRLMERESVKKVYAENGSR